jgi:hypothetical protein
MRLFYQSFGASRGSREGHYGQVLKKILDQAAAPKTEISIYGLSPHRAIAEQYRYLEFLDKADVMDNGLRAEREVTMPFCSATSSIPDCTSSANC